MGQDSFATVLIDLKKDKAGIMFLQSLKTKPQNFITHSKIDSIINNIEKNQKRYTFSQSYLKNLSDDKIREIA